MSLLNSVMGLVTPDAINKASSVLGENNSNISSAVSSMVPGLLGALLKKGDSPAVTNALSDASAHSGSILTDVAGLFAGKGNPAAVSVGNNFIGALFGSKVTDFISGVAKHAGISESSTTKLLGMVAPVVAAYLGKNASQGGGFNFAGLLGSLGAEKDGILSQLPSSISGLLGAEGGNIMSKLKHFFD